MSNSETVINSSSSPESLSGQVTRSENRLTSTSTVVTSGALKPPNYPPHMEPDELAAQRPATSSDNSNRLLDLAPELLLLVLHELDAPSLVCLALTCRLLNTSILQAFKVRCLAQVCPKDVRCHVLKALESKAYNVLVLADAIQVGFFHQRWRIKNPVDPPSLRVSLGIDDTGKIQKAIENLAFIRQFAWFSYPRISDKEATLSWTHSPEPAMRVPSSLLAKDSLMKACIPISSCWEYVVWTFSTANAYENVIVRIQELVELCISREIESVEFMVLKDLLKDWMVVKTT
ncbi:hypothetical protein H2200_000222 [Cladophialophora chaetospira]|uniref:F-box domain-containing protein n=1 Tax=Cladophialophora chaetospira TaxID=386627 RepID=A0AA38XN11_9EURO|nr:hypothetical protein H2200_000222 [Cladophialophora chaetospira]